MKRSSKKAPCFEDYGYSSSLNQVEQSPSLVDLMGNLAGLPNMGSNAGINQQLILSQLLSSGNPAFNGIQGLPAFDREKLRLENEKIVFHSQLIGVTETINNNLKNFKKEMKDRIETIALKHNLPQLIIKSKDEEDKENIPLSHILSEIQPNGKVKNAVGRPGRKPLVNNKEISLADQLRNFTVMN